MGHKSFREFFTDMNGVDAWQTVFVKVLLMLEILWTIITGFVLVIYFGIIQNPNLQPNETAAYLLILGHLGTPLTLITMLGKMEHGMSASWLKAWWLIVCHLLDARAIYEASKTAFAADDAFGTRTYLLVMSSAALIMSFLTIFVFAMTKWAPFNQKITHSDGSVAPLVPARDDLEQNNAQINASVPGIVSVRFPNKFVHQPARKAE
jgi:hypothetical protein